VDNKLLVDLHLGFTKAFISTLEDVHQVEWSSNLNEQTCLEILRMLLVTLGLNEGEPWVDFLSEMEYGELDLSQRVQVLSGLVGLVTDTANVRERVEASLEENLEMRKLSRSLRAEEKRVRKELKSLLQMVSNVGELKTALFFKEHGKTDLRIKEDALILVAGESAGQTYTGDRDGASVPDTGEKRAMDSFSQEECDGAVSHFREHLSTLEDTHRELVEQLEEVGRRLSASKNQARCEELGTDRYHNRYFLLPPTHHAYGKDDWIYREISCQGADDVPPYASSDAAVPTHWEYLKRREDFKILLDWLHPRGANEGVLRMSVQTCLDDLGVEEDDEEHMEAESGNAEGSKPHVHNGGQPVSEDLQSMEEILAVCTEPCDFNVSLRADTRLRVRSAEVYRCGMCLECVAKGDESHCSICHRTLAFSDRGKFHAHVRRCGEKEGGRDELPQERPDHPLETRFRVLKMQLLDIQKAIPADAVPGFSDSAIYAWRAAVKKASSLAALTECLLLLEKTVSPDWINPAATGYVQYSEDVVDVRLMEINTTHCLALRLHSFDRALYYTIREKRGEAHGRGGRAKPTSWRDFVELASFDDSFCD